jgi:hypothetical protein
MIEIINILTIISLGWLFINAEPIIIIKRLLGFKEEEYETYESFIKIFLHRLIYCQVCITFWIGIIYSTIILSTPIEIIQYASISSFITYILTKNNI